MSIIAKAVGITALGLAGYDTLTTSKRMTDITSKNIQIDRLHDVYSRTMGSDTNSEITAKMQKWTRNWYLSDNVLFKMKDNLVAFTSVFVDKVATNFSNLGLGLVALTCGKSKLSLLKLPILGKLAASLLMLKGAYFVGRNMFGIGVSDRHNNPYI